MTMSNLYEGRAAGDWRPASSSQQHHTMDHLRLGSSSSSGTETSSSDRLSLYYPARHDGASSGTASTSALPLSPSAGLPQVNSSRLMSSTSFPSGRLQTPLTARMSKGNEAYMQEPERVHASDWPVDHRGPSFNSSSGRKSENRSPSSSSAESQSTANLAGALDTARMDASPTASAPRSEGQVDAEKRRRIQQACKSCSSRRVKCDGQKPCQTCVKNGDECTYGQPKKRGPPKGTTRLARRSAPSSMPKIQSHLDLPDNINNQRGRPRRASRAESDPWRALPHNDRVGARYDDSALPHSLGVPSIPLQATLYGDRREFNKIPSDSHLPNEEESRGYHRTRPLPAVGGAMRSWQQQHLSAPPQFSDRRTHVDEAAGVPGMKHHAPALNEARRPIVTPGSRPSTADRRNRILGWDKSTTGFSGNTLPGHSHGFDNVDVADFAIERIRPTKFGLDDGASSTPFIQLKGGVHVDLNDPQIPEDTIARLFDEYWTLIHLYWPLFPRALFSDAKALREHAESRAPLLFNAICCISAATASQRSDAPAATDTPALSSQQLSDVFYIRAYYHHIRALMSPSLESTAALLLLSLREAGAGRKTNASHFVWLTCRMVMDLDIQGPRDMARRMGSAWTPEEDEWRRRVYWCAYVNDKNMAVQHGRPAILHDVEASCPLPTFDEDEEKFFWAQHGRLARLYGPELANSLMSSEPIKLSTYLYRGCHLAHIAEGIIALHTTEKKKAAATRGYPGFGAQFKSLYQQLEEWTNDIPESMRWRPGTASPIFPFVIVQHVWGEACKILLHRPFILTSAEGAEGINSHAEATKAVDTLIAMFHDFERYATLRKVTSGVVYCLFTAATILIGNLTSTDPTVADKARSQLLSISHWIRTIAETWNTAWRHLVILEKLAASMNVDLSETGIAGVSRQAQAFLQNPDASTDASVSLSHVSRPANEWLNKSGLSLLDRPDVRQAGMSRQKTPVHFPHSSMQREQHEMLHRRPQEQEQLYPSAASTSWLVPALDEQDIAAFWPDMPMGEDLQGWTSFTDTYLTVLSGNMMSSSAPLPSGAVSPSMHAVVNEPAIRPPHQNGPHLAVPISGGPAFRPSGMPARGVDYRGDVAHGNASASTFAHLL